MSDSLRSHGLYSPWHSPGQNTRVGSLSLLQGIFPTQGSNPGLPHCGQILYQLSHRASPAKSKHLLISWLQSPSAVILEPPKIKCVTLSPSIWHEVMGPDAIVFWMLSLKPTFSLSSFTFIKRLFSSSLSALRVVSSAYLRLLVFLPELLIPLMLPPAQHFPWCTLHIN